ncbi:SHOCT domain-containing protein, partial [Bacteroides acidifaciens]|uniref:SHOCT domain-containing protein n=1 Tax=Bacteroides acidifaciens TaxID=85831 RepID=UPI00338D7D17
MSRYSGLLLLCPFSDCLPGYFVSNFFSKEVILKNLLQEGLISDLEYERYDQLLYDRYQMDA